MKFRNLSVVAALALIVAATIWVVTAWNRKTHSSQRLTQAPLLSGETPQASPLVTPSATPVSPLTMPSSQAISTISPTQRANFLPASMPKGPYQGWKDPRWLIYWKKREQDRAFEWKTPIEFYDKVVDQDEEPIHDVEINMNWTDISPKGTSAAVARTDSEGKFSITGIQGKNFGVRSLKKDGYVEAINSNRHSFEYAGFWEPTYHEPDPNEPVIFHMRKKGEPAPLLSKKGEVVLAFGSPSPIPMPQIPAGGSPITVTLFERDAKSRKWRARLSVQNGGVLPALEEFPFEAPQEGYQASLDLNEKSPHPPGWQDLDEGGCFYIKTPQGYGLLVLRQIRGKKTLRYG